MKRFKSVSCLVLASLLIAVLMLFPNGSAQLSVKLFGPDGSVIEVTGRNIPRGDDALVLYDTAYGNTTRTNPYGVEVVALPSARKVEDGLAYQVNKVTSVWECEKNNSLETCGNAPIPQNGIVISATGAKRDLLKTLKPGDILTLQEEWFHRKQATLDIINPTPQTNPAGSGFPGYRASNQLILYDVNYGRPNTGTNEFGFEVTVQNGIVTDHEGSDSAIPLNGFVLSGHGRGRSWLIANAPIGAKIEINGDGKSLTSTIDIDTYLFQFDKRWQGSPCAIGISDEKLNRLCNDIRNRRDEAMGLYQSGRSALAASTIAEALEGLNRRTWLSYEAFPASTVRGAWHRPVEKTALAIGQTLDTLKASGLNAVFLETYFHGYTIFPSQTFANYGLPKQNPKFEGVDLLKLWVTEAHKRGMQVHVWFQTFYGGTKAYMPPGPILAKHPEWANVQFSALVPEKKPDPPKDSKEKPAKPKTTPENPEPVKLLAPSKPVPSTLELGGYFLDPANPAVQGFLLKLAEEIVTRYDVDGFQLDYIRYPASFPADRFSYRKTTWGYTNWARNSFKSQTGVDPAEIDPKDPNVEELWKAWADFKTDQVTGFVEKAVTMLGQKRPDLKISAAVFPEAENALLLKHQDWATWARNGWLDFLAPMTLTSAIKVVERDTRYMVGATYSKVPVYSGIFGPFNDNTAEHVLQQIDAAKKAGAKGYVLFDTAHLTTRMLAALKAMQVPEPEVHSQPSSTVTTPPPVPPQKPGKKKKRWWRPD